MRYDRRAPSNNVTLYYLFEVVHVHFLRPLQIHQALIVTEIQELEELATFAYHDDRSIGLNE